jgi:hypothetical protein
VTTVAAALAAAVVPNAAAETTIAQLKRPTPVSAYGGRVVWSAFDFKIGRYRLMTAAAGGGAPAPVPVPVPVAPRSTPFDADLGPDSRGRPTAVYSRCPTEPRGGWRDAGLAWETSRSCDLFRFDFAAGRERHIAGPSRGDASEFLPSLWRGRLAFTRVDERPGAARLARIYERSLASGRETLIPGGPPTSDPKVKARPAGLDLDGRYVAYVWRFRSAPQRENGPSTEVRVATAGALRSTLLSGRDNGDSIVNRVLSVPSLVGSTAFYALMTTGDSNGSRFHRTELPGGRRFHGPRDRVIVAAAVDTTATYVVSTVRVCNGSEVDCGEPYEDIQERWRVIRLDPIEFRPGFASGP